MKLTTRSRYATRLLLDIALFGGSGPVPVKDIAKRQRISKKYLEKLIGELKRAGYLTSKRGPKGGHMLARPVSDISLGEVIRALEGVEAGSSPCDGGEDDCVRLTECLTHHMWTRATQLLIQSLGAISLLDLMHGVGPSCPLQAPSPES